MRNCVREESHAVQADEIYLRSSLIHQYINQSLKLYRNLRLRNFYKMTEDVDV